MTKQIQGDSRPYRSRSLFIEAADDLSKFHWVCKEDKFLRVCPEPGCFSTFWYRPGDAIDDAPRCEHSAPPKPMSAEERWRYLARDMLVSNLKKDEFVRQIREAESAAWDRAVKTQTEADADLIAAWQAALPIRFPDELIAWKRGLIETIDKNRLSGKCHEVQP